MMLNCGTIPGGLVAWAHLKGPLGEFHSDSIYEVGTPIECTYLWHSLHDTLPHGDWIFGGDFNFTKSSIDSTAQSLLLANQELEEWRTLKCNFGLMFAHSILTRAKDRLSHGAN